jgi:hypothetical protein
MAVQVAALAFVAGNAMAGVEFEPDGDMHDGAIISAAGQCSDMSHGAVRKRGGIIASLKQF